MVGRYSCPEKPLQHTSSPPFPTTTNQLFQLHSSIQTYCHDEREEPIKYMSACPDVEIRNHRAFGPRGFTGSVTLCVGTSLSGVENGIVLFFAPSVFYSISASSVQDKYQHAPHKFPPTPCLALLSILLTSEHGL